MARISNNPSESRFERPENGQIAVAHYVLSEKTLTITHIIVPPEQRGRGVASELGAFIIQFARENGFKLRPQCAFMKTYMKRHRETADLRV